MTVSKEFIADLRGGEPSTCDFCREARPFEELEPEEAGAWVCHHCLRRWMRKDVEAIRVVLKQMYTDLEAAKWWFRPQLYLADRTPHEMLLMDQSEHLLTRLMQIADGAYV